MDEKDLVTLTLNKQEFAAIAGGLMMGTATVTGREDRFMRGVQVFGLAIMVLGPEGVMKLANKIKMISDTPDLEVQ